jgi:hypothetical protein
LEVEVPVIKVMTDYESHPLWMPARDGTVNIDPESLPITRKLVQELLNWADEYDATLNQADPLASGFSDSAAEDAFYERGKRLAGQLAAELPEAYEVEYFDGRDARVHPVT